MANKEIFLNSGAHKADLPKGTFDKSFRNHLTAKLGYLYPCLVEEAVAGSTYKIRPDMVFDLMPMAMPLQCRMRAHVSIFNVPFRIVMKNYKDYFSRVGDHAMPYIARSEDWVTPGSLADYLGVPTAQFGDIVRYGCFNWFLRGNCGSFTFTPLSMSLAGVDDLTHGDHYTFNELVVPSGSSNLDQLVISDSLENPFESQHVIISREGTSNVNHNLNVTNYKYNFYLFVSPRGQFRYRVFKIPTTFESLTYDFTLSASSTLATISPGEYHFLTSSYFNTNPTSSAYYYEQYAFVFDSDVIEVLNRFISNSDLECRLGFFYAAPSIPLLGCGQFNNSPLGNAVDASSFSVNINVKDGVDVTTITSVCTSRLVPSFGYEYSVGGLEESRKYFNVVDGQPPALPINALAFRAYEFIYNKYFRNLQVDKFYKNGEVSYNEYITNDGDGPDSTTPVELKRVPYEYDMFTTALPSPQMGYAPLVGVTTNDATGIGLLHMIPLVDGEPDPSQAYDIGVAYNSDNGDITGISNYDEVANKTSVARLREAIDFGISINDLRNVSAFQRLKEKMMKAGYEYQPLMEEFYGTTPPIGEEFPEYLGGFTREIQIGKIQNTALSAEHPLGEFAGVGGVAGSSRTIKVYTKEPSYIIGVLWFSVTPTYSQMLPKHFLKFHPLDYFNPTFNAIGPQPIHTHEIAPLQLAPENLNQVFGYQRPWYDYVSRVDECHGEFRTSMRHYLLQRLFAVAPELTANFINIHSEELTDIFTYTVDSDKFFGYIDFDIKCKSPVARVSVPRIIG